VHFVAAWTTWHSAATTERPRRDQLLRRSSRPRNQRALSPEGTSTTLTTLVRWSSSMRHVRRLGGGGRRRRRGRIGRGHGDCPEERTRRQPHRTGANTRQRLNATRSGRRSGRSHQCLPRFTKCLTGRLHLMPDTLSAPFLLTPHRVWPSGGRDARTRW
jgi:hypothetical protein